MGYRELSKNMSVRERVEFLISQGVEAVIDINDERLEFVILAAVKGVGVLPCGEFESSEAAIEAGQKWLQAKLVETDTPNSDKH